MMGPLRRPPRAPDADLTVCRACSSLNHGLDKITTALHRLDLVDAEAFGR